MDRRNFLKTVAVAGAAGAAATVLDPGTAEAAAHYSRVLPKGWTYPVAEPLLPFGHAVMSGDPLPDRVMLWTRITIPDARGWDSTHVPGPQGIMSVAVGWVIAKDVGLRHVIRKGTVTTSAARDWTVKVDADHLPAATTLYYAFTALGYRSPIGRTRTAPAATAKVTELTFAETACSSWWQDVWNGFARMGERNDLDLILHAGDHVYDSCGGHPASRFWMGQTKWDTDIDNRDFTTVAECRGRYALYYADRKMIAAHLAAPWAIMPDQHDDDPDKHLTQAQAREIFFEWTATRAVHPDGTGRFLPSPGPNVNVPIPQGNAAKYFYRTLRYGSLAEVILLDVRRWADQKGQTSQVLGDEQWAWLEKAFKASKKQTHRVVINQVNLSQLRAFNLPAAAAFQDAFGINPNAPQGELYTTAWGGHPEERTRLFQFLRKEGIVDNVVLSGDSHGWFCHDLVEDPELPSYEPATGGGLLGAVGVEIVPCAMARPGGQDVIAEDLYFQAVQGSRGAAFNDAKNYDANYRTAALAPTIALEQAAMAANPNLIYFNWRAEYGHVVVHLRQDAATLELWTSPQRVDADTATLLRQFRSPVGAPHLATVLLPRRSTAAAATPHPQQPAPSLSPRPCPREHLPRHGLRRPTPVSSPRPACPRASLSLVPPPSPPRWPCGRYGSNGSRPKQRE